MELNRLWLLFFSYAELLKELHSKPIVGGDIVDSIPGRARKYPFIVSLQDVSKISGKYEHFCGGSLISQRWLLTAAHCLWRKNITTVVAFIGNEDISELDVERDQYKLERVSYAAFQSLSYQNDIALARLEKPFVGHQPIETELASLPEYGMKPNRQVACTIIGYGALGHIGLTSNQLIEANVYVITNRECREKLGHVWGPRNGDNKICAVGEQQDSCEGDSGGPLLCRYGDMSYIYGIISHGIACGGEGIPSLYTVTIPYVNWIRSVIADEK